MARGILLVESHPSSPERVREYNSWYDEVHLPEVVALEAFVSARRLRPVGDDGPHIALYEIECDDLTTALDLLRSAAQSGALNMSDALQMDPPPAIRLLEVTTECEPGDAH
ncbi:hypothetical protein [Williamsia soli]|uniref:hypothetical protein n=1 Tax=Williamsia soli TaxID=364929 RepID=UPI001A9F5134|nr:hypothetical protein [Williamsia soli]